MPAEKLDTSYNHDEADATGMKVTGRGENLGTVAIRNDGIGDHQAPAYTPIDNKSPHTVKIAEAQEAWYSDAAQ